MLFNSFSYVLFLWTVYVLFWTWRERRSWRHTMVLVASYWFYGQAHWGYCTLLAISTCVDYLAGLGIERADARGDEAGRKRWLAASLATNLGLLGTFKYFDFFVGSFEALLGRLGVEAELLRLDVVLPVGISFYTFQTLSYTLDIYRRKMRPTTSLLDFAVFVSFFPQLVAGPIVRAIDFMPQLARRPELDLRRVGSGLFQILRGMAKKLLMADILGAHVVDVAFRSDETVGQLGAANLILATYAYALQLYGDFAGYSDIAIGSARLLGFELRKNFDAPFKSINLEEFWARWHISMSSWFTDYVYIGLGGSRSAFWRTARNTLVAWGAVGLWHGAAWTYTLWGLYHGVLLVLIRAFRGLLPRGRFPDHALFKVLGVLFTFHVVAFSMILFRCEDMRQFGIACRELLDWSRPVRWPTAPVAAIMILGFVTHFMPERVLERLEGGWCRTPGLVQGAAIALAMLLFFALRPPGLTPFVYFQF